MRRRSRGHKSPGAAVRQLANRPDQQLMVLVPLGVQRQPGLEVNFMPKDAWVRWHTGEARRLHEWPRAASSYLAENHLS